MTTPPPTRSPTRMVLSRSTSAGCRPTGSGQSTMTATPTHITRRRTDSDATGQTLPATGTNAGAYRRRCVHRRPQREQSTPARLRRRRNRRSNDDPFVSDERTRDTRARRHRTEHSCNDLGGTTTHEDEVESASDSLETIGARFRFITAIRRQIPNGGETTRPIFTSISDSCPDSRDNEVGKDRDVSTPGSDKNGESTQDLLESRLNHTKIVVKRRRKIQIQKVVNDQLQSETMWSLNKSWMISITK